MKYFYELVQTSYFWLAGILYLALMESIALYYQYTLQFYPCALCVQVRAWIVGAILSSAISVYFREKFWVRFAGISLTMVFISGGFYTSYYAWGVENGTVIQPVQWGQAFQALCLLISGCPSSLVLTVRADNLLKCGSDCRWLKHF